MSKTTIFWFRRDLRLDDNVGLARALAEGVVQPFFLFDTEILERLEDKDDARVHYIHEAVSQLKESLRQHGSDLWVRHGRADKVWSEMLASHEIGAVYMNRDEEPAALKRDASVEKILLAKGVKLHSFKDQSLFDRDEILTDSGTPYTVFTPYKRKVLASLSLSGLRAVSMDLTRLRPSRKAEPMPTLAELGFEPSRISFPPARISVAVLKTYDQTRDFPALEEGTTKLGVHFRFGTISPREAAREGRKHSEVWLSELIWRDFFKQILWHHPRVVTESFRPAYDGIAWRESRSDFQRWCAGLTGFPLVDAGMRELIATGHMHNRVRMVVASFLCKHLLIHWREGERWFARKLLDFDLSANNGNWQWAAGSGCDAAPYFRVFNPEAQAKRFDPKGEYIRRWVPEWKTTKYPKPMVDHAEARGRALAAYTRALKGVPS